MNAEIRNALEARKPEIAARAVASIRYTFENLLQKFGPTFKGIFNSQSVHVYKNVVQPVLTWQGEPSHKLNSNGRYVLDEVKLAARADAHAQATVEAWIGKIEAKLGELESAKVHYLSGNRFDITGTRGGYNVRIEQDMIINVSPKGLLFNQWPSRIYVNGKFTPEAKYKKLFV